MKLKGLTRYLLRIIMFEKLFVSFCTGVVSLGVELAAQTVHSRLLGRRLSAAASASHGVVSPYIPGSRQPPLLRQWLHLQGTCH